jgi:hypothetical protein
MREITNITSDADQRHIIDLEGNEIIFDLRFYPTIEQWCFNVEYQDRFVKGVKLSLSVVHMANFNFPFDFFVEDTSNTGIDPFKIDDFLTGRCRLYILDPADMESFRGVPVEI